MRSARGGVLFERLDQWRINLGSLKRKILYSIDEIVEQAKRYEFNKSFHSFIKQIVHITTTVHTLQIKTYNYNCPHTTYLNI